MKKNLKLKIGDSEILATVEELKDEKGFADDTYSGKIDEKYWDKSKKYSAIEKSTGLPWSNDDSLSIVENMAKIHSEDKEIVVIENSSKKIIERYHGKVADSAFSDFAAKGSFENIEELRSYFKNPNVSADGKKVFVELSSGEKLEYQYVDGSADKLVFIRSVKDSALVDAKDAYAVFFGGGAPQVCFASSEAGAKKWAEELEGEKSTKIVKIVRGTEDYDYYVDNPRMIPIADAKFSDALKSWGNSVMVTRGVYLDNLKVGDKFFRGNELFELKSFTKKGNYGATIVVDKLDKNLNVVERGLQQSYTYSSTTVYLIESVKKLSDSAVSKNSVVSESVKNLEKAIAEEEKAKGTDNYNHSLVSALKQALAGIKKEFKMDSAVADGIPDRPTIRGDWVWDEVRYDWYDKKSGMYYEEINRKYGLTDSAVGDSFSENIPDSLEVFKAVLKQLYSKGKKVFSSAKDVIEALGSVRSQMRFYNTSIVEDLVSEGVLRKVGSGFETVLSGSPTGGKTNIFYVNYTQKDQGEMLFSETVIVEAKTEAEAILKTKREFKNAWDIRIVAVEKTKTLKELKNSSSMRILDSNFDSKKSFSVRVNGKEYGVRAKDHAEALNLVRDALSVKDAVPYDTLLANLGFAWLNSQSNGLETWYYRENDDDAFTKAVNRIREARPNLILSSTNDGSRKITIMKDSKVQDASSFKIMHPTRNEFLSVGGKTWVKEDSNMIKEFPSEDVAREYGNGALKGNFRIMKDNKITDADAMPYNYVMRRTSNGAYLARGSVISEGIIYEGSSKLSGMAARFSKFAAEMLVKDLNRKSIELGHKGDWVIQEITAKDLGLSDALSEGTYYAVVNGKNKTLNIGQLNNPKSYTVMAYGLTSLAEAKEEKVSIARKWNMGPDLYIISYTGERFGWRNPSPDEGKNLKIVDDSSEVLDAEKTRYELIYLNNGETDSVFVEADSDSEAFESLKRDAGRGVNLLEFGKHVNGRYIILKKYY